MTRVIKNYLAREGALLVNVVANPRLAGDLESQARVAGKPKRVFLDNEPK